MFLKHSKRGLTLLEVMVTATIIMATIFAMCLLLSTLIKASQKTIDNSSGYLAADSIMKEFILEHKWKTPASRTGNKVFGYKNYNYKIDVVPRADLNLYQITVTVEWSQADGGTDGKVKKDLKAVVKTIARCINK